MNIQEQLAQIKPGKTYPTHVKVTEKDKSMVVEFFCQSYFVGMYCAIHINGRVAFQGGDQNNKTFTTKLKKDLKKAIERGATVEIGSIRDCKLTMD